MAGSTGHSGMVLGRILKIVFRLVFLMFCLWLGGFLQFVASLPTTDKSIATATDGVVVFTGGANRLDKAADVLNDAKARKMLISGVDPATTEQDLAAIFGAKISPAQFACCIELGYNARDTFGNALETAKWADTHDLDSFLLVTANYHMPRSLLLTKSAAPGRRIYPLPVDSGKVVLQDWWQRPGTARLLAEEYSKYYVVLLRLRFVRPFVSYVRGQLNDN